MSLQPTSRQQEHRRPDALAGHAGRRHHDRHRRPLRRRQRGRRQRRRRFGRRRRGGRWQVAARWSAGGSSDRAWSTGPSSDRVSTAGRRGSDRRAGGAGGVAALFEVDHRTDEAEHDHRQQAVEDGVTTHASRQAMRSGHRRLGGDGRRRGDDRFALGQIGQPLVFHDGPRLPTRVPWTPSLEKRRRRSKRRRGHPPAETPRRYSRRR